MRRRESAIPKMVTWVRLCQSTLIREKMIRYDTVDFCYQDSRMVHDGLWWYNTHNMITHVFQSVCLSQVLHAIGCQTVHNDALPTGKGIPWKTINTPLVCGNSRVFILHPRRPPIIWNVSLKMGQCSQVCFMETFGMETLQDWIGHGANVEMRLECGQHPRFVLLCGIQEVKGEVK